MPIRIMVNGAQGRMGQITVKALAADPDFQVVAETSRQDNLATMIRDSKAQIVVDFTHPSAVFKNAQTIIKAGARPLIGTTGLLPKQVQQLQALCKKLKRGGLIAPNFSIAMVLMLKYAQDMVKYFPEVEIIELHHDRKKDCPSGTALYTAAKLAEARGKVKKKKEKVHENLRGSRGADYQGIAIHAVRLPGLVAHEQLIFGDLGETLTMRHDSLDRQCFMKGVVLAAKKIMTMKTLAYGLEEVL